LTVDAHKAEIRLFDRRGRPGPAGSLVVDGRDLSNLARGFTLAFPDADHLPVLTVDLFLDEHEVAGEVTVAVPDETRAALVALGWTPPDPSGCRAT
jgi:hypothetical protein